MLNEQISPLFKNNSSKTKHGLLFKKIYFKIKLNNCTNLDKKVTTFEQKFVKKKTGVRPLLNEKTLPLFKNNSSKTKHGFLFKRIILKLS